MSEKKGKSFPPGSPEDIKLTLSNLQEFFTEKLKAVDLHAKGGVTTMSTANTYSSCNVDGTTDGDGA